jgi:hypothetical protein
LIGDWWGADGGAKVVVGYQENGDRRQQKDAVPTEVLIKKVNWIND